jgi:hypothetical protein
MTCDFSQIEHGSWQGAGAGHDALAVDLIVVEKGSCRQATPACESETSVFKSSVARQLVVGIARQ